MKGKNNMAKNNSIIVTPVGDRLLVEEIEAKPLSDIIVVPDNAKEKSQQCRVVALGDGRVPQFSGMTRAVLADADARLPFRVKVGELVLVGKYAGSELDLDGRHYRIICSNDILAIIS